jgi:hypothetical protein
MTTVDTAHIIGDDGKPIAGLAMDVFDEVWKLLVPSAFSSPITKNPSAGVLSSRPDVLRAPRDAGWDMTAHSYCLPGHAHMIRRDLARVGRGTLRRELLAKRRTA